MSLTTFERVGDVPGVSLRLLREAGRSDVADLVQATGAGFVDDGFVRVLDPGPVLARLGDLFEDPADAVPFASTALGDIVLARGSQVVVAQLRRGQVVPFAVDPGGFLAASESKSFRWVQLHAIDYDDQPRPGLERALMATPLRALGGSGRPESLRETDLLTAWLAASRVIGRASLP